MRYCLQSIGTCSLHGHVLTCPAKGGDLSVEVFSTRIVYVSYGIDGVRVPQCLVETNNILKGEPEVVASTFLKLTQDAGKAVLTANGDGEVLSVIITKETGNVEVTRNGKTVSGGSLGNNDTVIPRIQVRAFKAEGDKDCFVRLNFPIREGDSFYGLGDKSGKPDRYGRRLRMYNRDSLGYDAEQSDPLYKAIPFFLKQNRKDQTILGYYFPHSLIDVFDFGQESPFYSYVQLQDGPVGYYLFTGNDYKDILASYCKVTGFPELPPLFSFGFFGSSMNYVEPDDAAERILRYFRQVEENDIPCEGMYVSSGYLKADDGNRYSFFWNKHKFPDYGSYLQKLHERGYNLTMNIKPGILTTHPWYHELAEKGYFVHDDAGKPLVEFYWGGEASFIDFSNPQAKEWWKGQLKDKYISHGCTGIWNDNNECELEDPDSDSFKVRTLFPVKMCEAAYEAFSEMEPGKRHWIYTRSGYAGIQKFARTWTGDNTSTWKTLKYNQFQDVSLGLSGIPFYGNDLGGFFGDVPSEELLVRSCQSGVFQPRFVIHSWRADGNPTEPWTYPEALPLIRSLIKEHYRFMPYIYSTAFEAAMTGCPMDRPLFLEYPEDLAVPTDQTACKFGPSVLKLLVTEAGKDSVDVYLPQGTAWYDPEQQTCLSGGKTHTVFVPLGKNRYLAKVPSVIPVSESCAKLSSGRFDALEFLLYPGEKSCVYRYYEDDGQTSLDKNAYAETVVILSAAQVSVTVKKGLELMCGKKVRLVLPEGFRFACGKQELSVELVAGTAVYCFSGAYCQAGNMI